jgi:hypothetical protein
MATLLALLDTSPAPRLARRFVTKRQLRIGFEINTFRDVSYPEWQSRLDVVIPSDMLPA